jgi:hypothetical protein
MPADNKDVLKLPPVEQQITYTRRDAVLHALAVGFGRSPSARKERPYVVDAGRVMPTLADALVSHQSLLERAGYTARIQPVIEELRLRRPLADSGSLSVTSRATAAKRDGNLLEITSEARPIASDDPAFSLRRVYSRNSRPAAPKLPSRPADLSCVLESFSEQRLLARLVGRLPDDDGDASEILESSHVMGLVCRAVLQTICEFDHTLVGELSAYITGPFAAGETLRTDMWQEANVVSFSATAVERDEVIIPAGRCVLVT